MKIAACELAGRTGHEAGRELLASLYREETGEALPPIAVGERGKPFFPAGEWHFSITHTRRHAFCALSRREIGIDADALHTSLRCAKDYRERYTLFKLLDELGELEDYLKRIE